MRDNACIMQQLNGNVLYLDIVNQWLQIHNWPNGKFTMQPAEERSNYG